MLFVSIFTEGFKISHFTVKKHLQDTKLIKNEI